jgi:hypothetical protein
MYGVDFYSDSAPEKIASNFQLEVEYAYPGRSGAQVREYLLLDFVEYSQLSEFSAGIADDAKAASVLESQH